jgi:hypothetical protein
VDEDKTGKIEDGHPLGFHPIPRDDPISTHPYLLYNAGLDCSCLGILIYVGEPTWRETPNLSTVSGRQLIIKTIKIIF